MSAVPKKKLCWNCEGNVARDVDNRPYCGVYVHSFDEEENVTNWNPSYQSFAKNEEIPVPLYQIPQAIKEEEAAVEVTPPSIEQNPHVFNLMSQTLFVQLKNDLFPVLFLMTGSVFFLFGIVLLLFSQNGTLTLQWQSHSAYYFLLFAAPLTYFGWKFLQGLETEK